jgi:CRP/FNR family cyclic AMP-dependent transcriptional regulator
MTKSDSRRLRPIRRIAPKALQVSTFADSLSKLHTDLSKIVEAQTDNFCELASAAGLDPTVDFVGADLTDCDLAGLDLRNFDFWNADFRGANVKGTRFDPGKITGAKFDKLPADDALGDTKRTRDKFALLRNHSLFRDLPPAVIEHLGSYMKTRQVARGTTIFAKGDPGTGLIGVLAGTVKVSVASADGKDIVLNVFHEGDIFGEIALLDGRSRGADATAMSDCELIVIERRDFVPFLSNHPDVMLKFIEILCSRLRRTSEQVQDMAFLNLPTRLAKTLLQLTAAEDGSATRRKATITQREISQMIAISPESTTKQLRAWAKRGWIGLERGRVTILKPDRLTNIAEASEFDPS